MTQPIARIPHPQKSEQWVEARMPRAIDRHELERNADRLVRPIAVSRADGSVPIDPITKQPYVYVHHDRPSAAMICDAIWSHLVSWNIKDRTGNPVKFEKDNVAELFEDHLSCDVATWFVHLHAKTDAAASDVECKGKTCEEPGAWRVRESGEPFELNGLTITPFEDTVQQSYAVFLNNKIADKKTFDPDPLASGSLSQ